MERDAEWGAYSTEVACWALTAFGFILFFLNQMEVSSLQ